MAFARVQAQLAKRRGPAISARRPAMVPAPVARPSKPATKPVARGSGSKPEEEGATLLSAMRKVRKELEERKK